MKKQFNTFRVKVRSKTGKVSETIQASEQDMYLGPVHSPANKRINSDLLESKAISLQTDLITPVDQNSFLDSKVSPVKLPNAIIERRDFDCNHVYLRAKEEIRIYEEVS